jgi:hypothetical protein
MVEKGLHPLETAAKQFHAVSGKATQKTKRSELRRT